MPLVLLCIHLLSHAVQVRSLLIIFQLSKSKELGREMSLKLVDDFEEKCRKKINTSSLEFGPKEFYEGRIRLCYCCTLIMSCGVSLTCTDLKTFLKHAQQELQRVFNTACGFSNAQEVVHRQKAAMRTKVNVLRMHAHSLCNGRGKLTDSHIAGTCHSTFAVVTRQASRKGGLGGMGVHLNPHFDLQKILYTPLNCTF